MNQLDKIIAYENGDLDEIETIELFQELIDNGMAWALQGHYGRTAMHLIEAGLCNKNWQLYKLFTQIKKRAIIKTIG